MKLNGHEQTPDEAAQFLSALAYTEGLHAAANGNVQAAVAAFTEAIGYNLDNTEARNALVQLQERVGKYPSR